MDLGSLIARFAQETDASATFEMLGDLVLHAEVVAMATHLGEPPGAYVAHAVRRYASQAGEEEWLGLLAAVGRSDDPAGAALSRMLRWALRDDARSVQAPGGSGRACSCASDAPQAR
jgi:hypothetical protein